MFYIWDIETPRGRGISPRKFTEELEPELGRGGGAWFLDPRGDGLGGGRGLLLSQSPREQPAWTWKCEFPLWTAGCNYQVREDRQARGALPSEKGEGRQGAEKMPWNASQLDGSSLNVPTFKKMKLCDCSLVHTIGHVILKTSNNF